MISNAIIGYVINDVYKIKGVAHLCSKMAVLDMLSVAVKRIIFEDLNTLDEKAKERYHSLGYDIDSILDSKNPDRTSYSEEEVPDEKMPEAYHFVEASLRNLADHLQQFQH